MLATLPGRMMDYPLTLTHLVERAARFFPKSEVVSRQANRTLNRVSYADLMKRVRKLANALVAMGVKPGDRVATLAWNHHRHLELYLAVPAIGAVIHTLNLRLHPTEIAYIARHAEDKWVFADATLLPLLDKFRHEVPWIRKVVVMRDEGDPAVPPEDAEYEALLAPCSDAFEFPMLDENAASMICYTSGTTGNPKGVVYSHRSMVMHTIVACMADSLAVGERDIVLPVVPMFHAAAWGLPYAAVMAGSNLVFPGPHLDAKSILELMQDEKVTIAAGVPTIWLGILSMLDAEQGKWNLGHVRTTVIGGAAAPPSMIQGFAERHGVVITHAWGMTETNPLGTLARVKSSLAGDPAQELRIRSTQGYAVPFVEQRHADEAGKILPWDGETMGELEVRGPFVAKAYFSDEGSDRFTADGWFKTGDVVTIDAEGYVRITDRSKDVIKSGGEWISSVQLENALMSHPAVLESAVFAGRHEKWDERPIAAIVLKPGQSASEEELRAHLEGHFAKFWMPDAFVFVQQIPRTSTGKFLKSKLRAEYGEMLIGK
jgi:fatty-acyl-CoA synthase